MFWILIFLHTNYCCWTVLSYDIWHWKESWTVWQSRQGSLIKSILCTLTELWSSVSDYTCAIIQNEQSKGPFIHSANANSSNTNTNATATFERFCHSNRARTRTRANTELWSSLCLIIPHLHHDFKWTNLISQASKRRTAS